MFSCRTIPLILMKYIFLLYRYFFFQTPGFSIALVPSVEEVSEQQYTQQHLLALLRNGRSSAPVQEERCLHAHPHTSLLKIQISLLPSTATAFLARPTLLSSHCCPSSYDLTPSAKRRSRCIGTPPRASNLYTSCIS